MKVYVLFVVQAVIFFSSSCTKEISREQDDNPIINPPSSDTISTGKNKFLVRLVNYEENFPLDSSVDTYSYDHNKKIIGLKSESFGPGIQNYDYYNTETVFYRDADGMIKRIAIIDSYYEGLSLNRTDSAEMEMFHDPVSKHYTYAIHTINLASVYTGIDYRIRDSVAYTYDAKDRIVLYQRFRRGTSTNIVFEAQRYEYTYDINGNISRIASNENFDNMGDPLSESFLIYEDTISPFTHWGNDGILMGTESFGNPSPNNVVKSITGGVDDASLVYTYDVDKYPAKAISTYKDALGKVTTYFYYQ